MRGCDNKFAVICLIQLQIFANLTFVRLDSERVPGLCKYRNVGERVIPFSRNERQAFLLGRTYSAGRVR